jgi:hypothetical protein
MEFCQVFSLRDIVAHRLQQSLGRSLLCHVWSRYEGSTIIVSERAFSSYATRPTSAVMSFPQSQAVGTAFTQMPVSLVPAFNHTHFDLGMPTYQVPLRTVPPFPIRSASLSRIGINLYRYLVEAT